MVFHTLTLYAEPERPIDTVSTPSQNRDVLISSKLTLLNLLLLNVPKLVDLGSLASDNTLGELNRAADSSASGSSVLCGLAGNLDETNTGILGTAVVLAITEVAEPGLERCRVVLLDAGAVGLDGSGAGDAGPLAAVVEESEVDVRVLLEVVGLAGLGVGVEDEIDAVVLLRSEISLCRLVGLVCMCCHSPWRRRPCICWQEDHLESRWSSCRTCSYRQSSGGPRPSP
jgi:hypothetical protein